LGFVGFDEFTILEWKLEVTGVLLLDRPSPVPLGSFID
jgi:hypothetical protein